MTVKKYIILLFIASCSLQLATINLYAQHPTLEWLRKYPDSSNIRGRGFAMTLDDSGNVYATGSKEGNQSGSFGIYCTVKYSSLGVQLWKADYKNDTIIGGQATAIITDKLGNIYVTGIMHRSGILYDYCTLKYNALGTLLWVQYYDGFAHDEDHPTAIAVDNANNIYVTGYSSTGGAF